MRLFKNLDQLKTVPLFKIFNEMGRCLKVCSFQITKDDLDSAAVSYGIHNYCVRYVKSGRIVKLSKLPLKQDVRITDYDV